MATLIRLKRKKSSGNAGIVLAAGEAYYNTADKRLYIGNTDGEDVSSASKKHIVQITPIEAGATTVKFQLGEDESNVYEKIITAEEIEGTISSAMNATNVTSTIAGAAISTLFNMSNNTPTKAKSAASADSASKLASARNLITKLNSTTAGSFDGSANVNIGISGTLPLANGGTGATTATQALKNLGIDASATAVNFTGNVTSDIQEQLNSKQSKITGAATSVTSSNLTSSRVLVSNSSGKIAASSKITSTELDYLDGVNANIQTQLNSKASSEALTWKQF